MKPTIEQIEIAKWCINTIQTWINTNAIESSTPYNDLHNFIETDLEEYPDVVREDLEEALSNILDIIQNV